MRGDFGFPLDEFWRVATTQKEAELLKSVQRCARVVSSTMMLSLIGSLNHRPLIQRRPGPRPTHSRSAMPHSQSPDVSSPQLPSPSKPVARKSNRQANDRRKTRRPRRTPEKSEVLVSAVISTYLLTHLHHVLQRAEYSAVQDGRRSQAANYAQLRKVLCMDARSMEDASASGLKATELDQAA